MSPITIVAITAGVAAMYFLFLRYFNIESFLKKKIKPQELIASIAILSITLIACIAVAPQPPTTIIAITVVVSVIYFLLLRYFNIENSLKKMMKTPELIAVTAILSLTLIACIVVASQPVSGYGA